MTRQRDREVLQLHASNASHWRTSPTRILVLESRHSRTLLRVTARTFPIMLSLWKHVIPPRLTLIPTTTSLWTTIFTILCLESVMTMGNLDFHLFTKQSMLIRSLSQKNIVNCRQHAILAQWRGVMIWIVDFMQKNSWSVMSFACRVSHIGIYSMFNRLF